CVRRVPRVGSVERPGGWVRPLLKIWRSYTPRLRNREAESGAARLLLKGRRAPGPSTDPRARGRRLPDSSHPDAAVASRTGRGGHQPGAGPRRPLRHARRLRGMGPRRSPPRRARGVAARLVLRGPPELVAPTRRLLVGL